jgi:GGDEF domain-containing protein
VTLSAGIAGFPEHASSARELLQVADACLYEAKKSGRDGVILAKAKVPLDRHRNMYTRYRRAKPEAPANGSLVLT